MTATLPQIPRRTAKAQRETLERQTDVLLFLQRLDGVLHAQERFWRAATEAGVLASGLFQIPAAGYVSLDWEVEFRSLHIANLGSGTMTIANFAPTNATAPTQGTGVKLLPDGDAGTMNILGRALTIWGNVGDRFNLEVFEKPQPPSYASAGNAIGDSLESTAPLLANATFNGAARSAANYSKMRGFAYSDQTGSITIQQSRDGVTWYPTVTQAVGAGGPGTVVESLLALPLARVSYLNGGTAQGTFELDSALVAI